MSNIILLLDQRAANDPGGLEQKLSSIAHDIIKISSDHQKRVLKIMQEFDLHDENHLAKVEDNVANILDVNGLKLLSSLELFILIASCYLHDCGMAPADWEIITMSLTEGSEQFSKDANSIKNDGKKPYSFTEAKTFINQHKQLIYRDFDSIKDWTFAPSTENDLIEYLAVLLTDYQEFRNGYSDRLGNVSNICDFENLNNEIRLDYIRINHHKKSEEYIMNLKPLFRSLGEGWSDRLLVDISHVCRAHGESLDYVRKLKTAVKYIGDESVNLQFAAEMLRLGDIIHYSNDRAPSVIRLATQFKSEYSKHEWAVKIGLYYSIKNSSISFMANCQCPDDYYHLQEYLDWIDEEILNLDTLKKQWDSQYKLDLHEVDRSNVDYDQEAFRPVLGKKFSLSQNKIIDLLMGVNLYKDSFSCIRELYQNSLDACRCRMEISRKSGAKANGEIDFYIEEDKGEKFLCWQDNGLGMSENVIENYLLKIGNSYYKSMEFNRRMSSLESSYTPVSQFGIGILSCFIIGSRIEIVTNSVDDGKLKACCIEGAKENFYYRKPTREEQEQLSSYGTIVKIQLKDKYRELINTIHIEKLGIVLQCSYDNNLPQEFIEYKPIFETWENSLYRYLNNYISEVPEGIVVNVVFNDGCKQQIYNKPMALGIGELGITEEDIPFIDKVIENRYFRLHDASLSGIQKHLKHYPIRVESSDVSFSSILSLPLSCLPMSSDGSLPLRALRVNGSDVCVDGISVLASSNPEDVYYTRLTSCGTINYIGKDRPMLSVDRLNIVGYKKSYENIYKEISLQEIIETIKIAQKHIIENGLEDNKEVLDQIWNHIFKRLDCSQALFINYLANSELGNMEWAPLSEMIGKSISIRDIVSAKEITLIGYNHLKQDSFTQKVIMSLLMGAERIQVNDCSTIKILNSVSGQIPEYNMSLAHNRYLVPAEDGSVFEEYDIVSNLYPIVPKRLIQALKYERRKVKYSNALIVSAFTNCYNELFFQDSRLVNPQIGLYSHNTSFWREPDYYIHRFETLKTNFQCCDFIPNYYDVKKIVPILAYISPTDLTQKDKELIKQYEYSEPDYFKGVHEGWTVLVTNMDIQNVIIRPGKVNRNTMISLISDEFWKEYKDWTFTFLDGTIMLPIRK